MAPAFMASTAVFSLPKLVMTMIGKVLDSVGSERTSVALPSGRFRSIRARSGVQARVRAWNSWSEAPNRSSAPGRSSRERRIASAWAVSSSMTRIRVWGGAIAYPFTGAWGNWFQASQ